MKGRSEKKVFDTTTLLIALCWVVYTCSYLGKLGYNANITQIETEYCISHSTAGMVSTFFFFAYGIGQIFNGIFCKRYPFRFFVFGSLILSGLMNLFVGIFNNFAFVKYFWLINGAALSVLWPSLISLLSQTLDKKDVPRAVFVMGTTVATGTFFVYGLSALFVSIGFYKLMFIVAGTLLPSMAILWFVCYPKLVYKKLSEHNALVAEKTQGKQKEKLGILWFPICILAIFAVVDNLVKDGLTTWVPMILKETYALPDFVSILLTIALPLLAVCGIWVVLFMRKRIADFVVLAAILFGAATLFIGIVILCLPTGLFVVTVGSFGVVACLMSGVNNIVTSMAPLYWKDKLNSGRLAGILNGFCYLGSSLSSYGLGVVADIGGWDSVFWLLFGLCLASVCIGVCYSMIKMVRRRKSERMA